MFLKLAFAGGYVIAAHEQRFERDWQLLQHHLIAGYSDETGAYVVALVRHWHVRDRLDSSRGSAIRLTDQQRSADSLY